MLRSTKAYSLVGLTPSKLDVYASKKKTWFERTARELIGTASKSDMTISHYYVLLSPNSMFWD